MKTGNGAAEGAKSNRGEKWKTATPVSANSIRQAGCSSFELSCLLVLQAPPSGLQKPPDLFYPESSI